MEENKKLILNVLLSDFESMRMEAREIISSHWTYSVPFTLLMAGTFIAGIFKPFVMLIVPFFVLAQFATILNYHYGYIYLVNNYIKLIEQKINILLNCKNILEYENEFVPKYFSGHKTQFTFNPDKIITNPQPFLAFLMLVPSFIIYLWSIFSFSNYFFLYIYSYLSSNLYLIKAVELNIALTLTIIGAIVLLYMAPLVLIYYLFSKSYSKIQENFKNFVEEGLNYFKSSLDKK